MHKPFPEWKTHQINALILREIFHFHCAYITVLFATTTDTILGISVQICISVQVCGILDPPFQVKVNPSAIFQVENYFLLNYQQNRKPLTRLATRPISDPISWSSGAVTGNIIDLSQTRPLLVAVYHKISISLEAF